MSRRKQDKPQHLAQANETEDRASEMSSHDVGRIERSTESKAFSDRETPPCTNGASEAEEISSEVPLDDPEDTVPDEESFSSPESIDESLKCQSDVERPTIGLPVDTRESSLGKERRQKTLPTRHGYPDSEDAAVLHQVDSRGRDSGGGSGGDRNTSRPPKPGCCAVDVESHVTKLQSFVDSLSKLTEPSYVSRPEPPFLPQYPKITPKKVASGCLGSYSGSSVRSGFPYVGYHQLPPDERSLAPITSGVPFASPLEQPLDLSTKRYVSGFKVNEDSRMDQRSNIASPEVRRRCLERSERLQAELPHQRTPYSDIWKRSRVSRPVVVSPAEVDHVTSLNRSGSYSSGKHRDTDAGKYKREQTATSYDEFSSPKASHAKSEIVVHPKETKNAVAQHISIDDAQRSSGKRKYSTLDQGSAPEGERHSPGSEATPKCQRQSARYSGDGSHEIGEGEIPRKEDREYMNMKCSCGTLFESLYHLAIHIERSGHVPGSLRPESLADLPKLVRGQDVWMSQGPEQAELILRCVQCRTSFPSLPELTIHMIRTKHYVNIVGTDGSAGQTDYGEPPWEKEYPQRGTFKDSRRKNDAYVPSLDRDVTERSMEVVQQQRLQKNKSPRHNDEATNSPIGLGQSQTSYSGNSQLKFLPASRSQRSAERDSEVERDTDRCQENYTNQKQLSLAYKEVSEISEKVPTDPSTVALDELKKESRTEMYGGQESQRRHSLATRLHSKIAPVTGNIQERTGLNQSANLAHKEGAPNLHSTTAISGSRQKTRALRDGTGIWEKVSDPAFAEKHSSTGALRIQSPNCKDITVISQECTGGVNDGSRRNKRPRDTGHEAENDRSETKSKRQSGFWKPGHHPSKDPKASRCLMMEGQPEVGPSTQDLRKERLLLNVSRWIASTELETKRDCVAGETLTGDGPEPVDNRLELVSPPSQPVETSSILVAIKNFVDSSFCGQTFVSGSHLSNQATFPSSSFPSRNPVSSGGKFLGLNSALLGACDNSELPSRSATMNWKPHLDVPALDRAEGKPPRRETSEEKVTRWSQVDDSSCKQPLAVALSEVSKANTQPESEKDHPEYPSTRDCPASPLQNCRAQFSDSKTMKRLEGSESKFESLFVSNRSGGPGAEEVYRGSDGPRNGVTSAQHAPLPESKPDDDSSDTVELEECSPAAETISTETDCLAVDSTAESHHRPPTSPSSTPPVDIVPTAFVLSDDPLRDRSTDRKSITKPISFFLSSRSFETVC